MAKATRVAFSKGLNAGKYDALREQTRRLGRIRSDVWQRYGPIAGVSAMPHQHVKRVLQARTEHHRLGLLNQDSSCRPQGLSTESELPLLANCG